MLENFDILSSSFLEELVCFGFAGPVADAKCEVRRPDSPLT